MKIAVACVDLVPENARRQPWFYLDALARALRAGGHEVWVLTDKEGDWPDGRRTLTMQGFRSFPRGIDPSVGPRLAREGFDLVFWSTGLTDFFFRRGLEPLEIPVIAVVTSPRYTARELLTLGPDLFCNWRLAKQFLLSPFISPARVRRVLGPPNLKAVLFQCRGTRDRYLPEGYDRAKAVVIPPPLPREFLDRLGEIAPERKTGGDKSFKILYFGPPITVRGIDTLVEAMARVAQSRADARLEILSRIEHKELLAQEQRLRKRILKRGLASRVEVVSGVLSPGEMVSRILAADVICLPFKGVVSDVPIAVLEAMATGIPLVTTEVAGVSEFARNSACHVIPPRNPKALAEAILQVWHRREAGAGDEAELEKFRLKHDEAVFASSINSLLQKAV
jgi:glycosyltransferase involved in cell wall biosynthesis